MSDYDIDEMLDKIDWQKCGGLVPVVVQESSGKVLTLAYMNRDALKHTVKTGYAHYYSRSKKRVRMKGEVSGNVQRVKEIFVDCDNDALLLKVDQKGVACHTGHKSCFYKKLGEVDEAEGSDGLDYSLVILKELEEIVRDRKEHPRKNSYTSTLFESGRERICKKVGEEAVEVIVARNREELVREVADLLYHLIVLLVHDGIELSEVMKELRGRRK